MIGFTSRSSVGLPQQLEALDQAVDLAQDRLDEEQVVFGRHVVDKAAARLRHGTTRTLVAVLGATGSGKSSVTNLIVGDDVATTGVRRPTTSSTLACFWGDDDAQGLLDWLEIKNRHHVPGGGDGGTEDRLDGLVLLDVPDHDSVAEAHRVEMERIAEHADMLLWVTDSEKYADKAMHDYLGQLAGHGAVMAMALNKIDQLSAQDAATCHTDLKRLLGNAGLEQSPVVSVSALTGAGSETLVELLADTVKGQQAVIDRLSADTTMAAEGLLDDLGPAEGASSVPKSVTKGLVGELVDAAGLPVVTDAVGAGYRRDAAAATGWPFTRWVRRLRPHPLNRFHLGQGTAGRASLPKPSGVQVARTQNALRTASTEVSKDMSGPWPDLINQAASPDSAELADRLDQAVSQSVRTSSTRKPVWWTVVNVLQIVLALAVVAGAVWLGLLAFAAYLRIPEPPTPEFRNIPIPTGLVIGGIVIGLLLAFLSARFAVVGAARRSRAVRSRAEDSVAEVTDELVINPMQAELERRQELHSLLTTAAGR